MSDFPSTELPSWRERAEKSLAAGQLDAALTEYTEALRHNNADVSAFVGRGGVYYALRHWDQAIADYTLALRQDPTLTVAYVNRANASIQRGDDAAKAIADYTRAIECDGDNWRAYLGRSQAYEKLGRHNEAELDQQKAAVLAEAAGVNL